MITQYSSSLAFYISLGYLLNLKYNKKLSSNYVSFTHASGAVLLASMYKLYQKEYFYHFLKLWSSGYFAADSVAMIKDGKFDILHFAYLYHHMATTYILHQNPSLYMGIDLMLLGELSNIPTYFVYHYLHTNPPALQKIIFWKWVQKYLYTIIRIPILGIVAYRIMKKVPTKTPIVIASPIYLMGLIWAVKIVRKNHFIENK